MASNSYVVSTYFVCCSAPHIIITLFDSKLCCISLRVSELRTYHSLCRMQQQVNKRCTSYRAFLVAILNNMLGAVQQLACARHTRSEAACSLIICCFMVGDILFRIILS